MGIYEVRFGSSIGNTIHSINIWIKELRKRYVFRIIILNLNGKIGFGGGNRYDLAVSFFGCSLFIDDNRIFCDGGEGGKNIRGIIHRKLLLYHDAAYYFLNQLEQVRTKERNMGQKYILPEYGNFRESVVLAKEFDCAFEYQDFFMPEILDSRSKQEKIIAHYAGMRTDFSEDTMHGAFFDVAVHSMDSLMREASALRIRQSMDIAKRMGLGGVVFHTGRIGGLRDAYYLKRWLEMNGKFFRGLAEEYPDINIYLENVFDEAPDILAKLAKSMTDVKNFGICLDYAHAALTGYSGEDWVEELAPYIRHLHVSDHDLIHDLHQPLGDGKINWQLFERLMWQYQVEAGVVVEVKGTEAQRKSLEYMKQYHVYPMNGQKGE